MIEKQTINEKDVWLKVERYHVSRDNANVIPTEYFTVSYYLIEPSNETSGEILAEENGDKKLFESPVAAISYAAKKLQTVL